jgi:hypothetical protein
MRVVSEDDRTRNACEDDALIYTPSARCRETGGRSVVEKRMKRGKRFQEEQGF